MEPLIGIVAVVFGVIVAPVWIIAHYAVKWRQARSLSPDDERTLAELWESANKIEARLKNLEAVLEAQAPEWRNRA